MGDATSTGAVRVPGAGRAGVAGLAAVLATVWAVLTVLSLAGAGPLPPNTQSAMFSAAAAVALAWAAWTAAGRARTILGLWALSQALFALGDAVWAANELRGVATGAVSFADVLYLTGYPVLAVAVVLLVMARCGTSARAALTDGLILGVVSGMVVWQTLLTDVGGGSWLAAAAYPVGDAVLLACLMWLVIVPGRRDVTLWLLTAHLATVITADVVYAIDVRGGGAGEGGPIAFLYDAAYLLLALAALHPGARRVGDRAPADLPGAVGGGRVLLLGVGIVAAPATAVATTASGRPVQPWVFLAASAVLSLLIVGRMAAIVRHAGRDRQVAVLSEARLEHRATHDMLTGLANRAAFLEALEAALAARRPERAVAVMFIDLDEFKLVNDSYGHIAGDQLLSLVAARISGAVRGSDLVARLGGDEFTVLADVSGAGEAHVVAERILAAMDAPFLLEGREVYVTGSVGIALAEPGGDADAPGLMRDADIALYRAKDSGRARCQLFGTDMRRWVAERHSLENDLRHALNAGGLGLEYQPQVDLEDGRIVGVEALVRWDHPVRGRIGPAEFIPVAEATGLIVPIGEWVLARACLDARRWNPPGAVPLHVSVNVSVRQLAHAGLIEAVQAALRASGVSPGLIVLELTETALAGDPERAVARLQALRDIGLRLELDDFGVGQSSLAALRSFPLDGVKIDRGFMAGVGTEDRATQSLAAVITLIRALGLQCVAEGVETRVQERAVRMLGGHRGQGYLYSPPVPAEHIDRLVAAPRVTAEAYAGV